jgi:hypothetical protein
MATQAAAEREWARLHPGELPYFKQRFEAALASPPCRGRLRKLLPWVPRSAPVIGERVWRSADLYFRQQLAGPFLAAWNAGER